MSAHLPLPLPGGTTHDLSSSHCSELMLKTQRAILLFAGQQELSQLSLSAKS